MPAEGFPVIPVINGDKIFISIKQLSDDVFKHAFFDEGVSGNTIQLMQECVDIDNIELPSLYDKPDVLIFHISHCGSSLLGQLLKIKNNFRVIGEPEVINTILLQQVLTENTPDALCIQRLYKATYLLLNAQRSEPGLNAIKLSSWNIFYTPLLKTAFPESQFIYVHRHPLEVISSLFRHPNGFAGWHLHTAPVLAAHFLSCSRDEVKQMSEYDYYARMLCKHMQHALHELPAQTMYLYYPDWVSYFPSNLSPVTTFTDVEKEQIKQQLKRNAKLPDQAFKYTQPLEVTQHLQAEVLQELLYLHKNLMQKIGL